jgi:hypothetical protein
MKTLDSFSRFFLRFRYPVALPEDIASALGVEVSNYLTFDEFIGKLTGPECCPTRLMKFMPREMAEQAFNKAQRKEHFMRSSLFSFYFNEGWMEFKLEFDSDSLLRRMYIQHKEIEEDYGIELPLQSDRARNHCCMD